MSPSQSRNTKKLFQDKPKVAQWKVFTIGKNSGGACTTNNSCVLVKLAKNEKIVGRSYESEFAEATKDIYEWHKKTVPTGWSGTGKNGKPVVCDLDGYGIAEIDRNGKPKFFTMSSLTKAVDNNIAPTVTHEFAHLIHNKVDPKTLGGMGDRVKIKEIAAKLGVKLSDAPTTYGSTNWSEFWTESWTAYTYAPKWFETEHNAAFKLFEQLLNEYQIDPKTIKQFKQ